MKIVYATAEPCWKETTPQNQITGVGPGRGRELALIYNALAMAGLGHNVAVYTTCPVEQEFGRTIWRNIDSIFALKDEAEPIDVLVAWAWPHILGGDHWNEHVRLRIASEHTLDFVSGSTEPFIDLHLCQSQFHAATLKQWDPTIDPTKVVVCPSSGVHLSEFVELSQLEKRVDKFVWLSSPDRGLHHFLKIWPIIREQYPNATLDIFYATKEYFDQAVWGSDYRSEVLNSSRDRLDLPGVTLRGPRPRKEYLRELAQCEIFFYPMDPIRWAENLCLVVQEAMAASCAVVTSDADCLNELYGKVAWCIPHQELFNYSLLAERLLNLMRDREAKGEYVASGWSLVQQCNIIEVAKNWAQVFSQELAERGHSN